MRDVELMAAGENVRGHGSPEEGEVFSERDLEELVEATREAGRPVPCRVGHFRPNRDDEPAVGWVHPDSLRVRAGKLVADLVKVPRKFARLVEAGAFRGRSVETVTDRLTGRDKNQGCSLAGRERPRVRGSGRCRQALRRAGEAETPGNEGAPESPFPPRCRALRALA
jgi:hypothetical protein